MVRLVEEVSYHLGTSIVHFKAFIRERICVRNKTGYCLVWPRVNVLLKSVWEDNSISLIELFQKYIANNNSTSNPAIFQFMIS